MRIEERDSGFGIRDCKKLTFPKSEIRNPKLKIGIIGAGRIGGTLGFCIAKSGIVNEIVLIDTKEGLAYGEAEDINQGLLGLLGDTICEAGNYKDLQDAKIVIITAGLRRKEGETRLNLINKNLSLMKDIVNNIIAVNNNCLLFVVSNPVDIMTYVALKISKFKKGHVFGLGTYLDTLRLLSLIRRKGENLENAMMIGEHGDSMVALSCCNKEIIDKVKKAGAEMIKLKGGAGWAVGLACMEVVKAIILDKKRVFPLSSLVSNWYGVSDICISTPTMIGKHGIIGYPEISITSCEIEKFQNSARIIREEITRLNLELRIGN